MLRKPKEFGPRLQKTDISQFESSGTAAVAAALFFVLAAGMAT